MLTKQTDGKFEKWVESGLSTFEIRRLVAEIYFSLIQVVYLSTYLTLKSDVRLVQKYIS